MYMRKPWFHAKHYGWGWTPYTWQGWGLTLLWILALTGYYIWIDGQMLSFNETLVEFGMHAVTLTGLFIIIAALTGEKPEWRWAGKRVSPALIIGKMAMMLFVILVLIIFAVKVLEGATLGS